MDVVRLELTKGHVAVIDTAEFEAVHAVGFRRGLHWTGRVCDLKWQALETRHTVYARTMLAGSIELRLHRVIMDATADHLVDHRDGNGLNNLRTNLRFATFAGNARNRHVSRASSRFKGVLRTTRRTPGQKLWVAHIRVDRRKIHLGSFNDETEAAKAYDAAAREHFGEFACTNF